MSLIQSFVSSLLFCLIVVTLIPDSAANQNSTCQPIKKAPAASTLRCSPTACNVTCAAKHKFQHGETVLNNECVNNKWVIKNPKYKNLKELPGCQPVCAPACLNKGKCIAPNKCQCTKDFQGPVCKEKACPKLPAMTRNSKRTCRPTQCSVTCLPGFKFKSLATTMNLQCRNGKWGSVSKNLNLNTHCEPHCSSKCLNGGKCTGPNKCECTEKFIGPQCQHIKDKCSLKSAGFNGSFKCLSSPTEMSCSLACPDGIEFDSPPASIYKCKFSEGTFTPANIPKCSYSDDMIVIERLNPVEGQSGAATNPFSAPTCNPPCQNGGHCVFHNMCQCQENFGGKQCQYSADRCSPKKIGFNGGFSCSGDADGMSCKLSCPQGIQFERPPAASYKCSFETGLFTPANAPKCVYGEGVRVISAFGPETSGPPTCTPACQNGGSCIFHNMCQCQQNFRGAQCQYSTDRCSIKNTDFNGGFSCKGTSTELSCTISCPEGVDYEFPRAEAYVCKYETGQFSPAKLPKCVFGEGVQVIRRTSSN